MWRRLSLACIAVLFNNTLSLADTRCISNHIAFDVCEQAKKIQSEASKSLPVQMNQNMTWESMMAIGPRLVAIIRWEMNDNEFRDRLKSNGMTASVLKEKMTEQSKKMVCSQETNAAMIRLGGEYQYIYKTRDGTSIADVLITKC